MKSQETTIEQKERGARTSLVDRTSLRSIMPRTLHPGVDVTPHTGAIRAE